MKKHLTLLQSAVITLISFGGVAQAATVTVTSTADSGAGSLRQAIANANTGDTVNIGVSGTITLTSGELSINKALALQGPGADVLTLAATSSITAPDSRALNIANVKTTVSGLAFTAGRAESGGAIYNAGALTVTGCRFTGNKAANGGGVFIATGGTGQIEDSSFNLNEAGSGAGLYLDSASNLTLVRCTLQQNYAANGGGVMSKAGILSIEGSTFSGNGASLGGAIHSAKPVGETYNKLTIVSSSLRGNTASAAGGAIYSEGDLSLEQSTVSGNTVTSVIDTDARGGGICQISPDNRPVGYALATRAVFPQTYARGCTIANNSLSASGTGKSYGGGIFGSVFLFRSTVYGNSAQQGGGVYTANGNGMIVTSSTVSGNSAPEGGGGLVLDFLTVTNSIVAGNTSNAIAEADMKLEGRFGVYAKSNGCNIVGIIGNFTLNLQSGSPPDKTGTVATPFNPKLAPLADNGGPTQTCALLDSSPAIDAARNIDAKDQRGLPMYDNPAISDPNLPNTTNYSDIGAYELQELSVDMNAPQVTVDTPADGTVLK